MTAKYGKLARRLHWSIAGLTIFLVLAGFVMRFDLAPEPLRHELSFLHIGIGLTMLALMVWRVAVRLAHRPPPLPATISAHEQVLARAGHAGLYALLFAMPVFGVLFVQARGRVVSWFGLLNLPQITSKSDAVHEIFACLHFWGGIALITLIAAHIGALVWHKRQGIALLARMWP